VIPDLVNCIAQAAGAAPPETWPVVITGALWWRMERRLSKLEIRLDAHMAGLGPCRGKPSCQGDTDIADD
jgi:hypothetical protein